MAKFASYDEMVTEAGRSYQLKATGSALEIGLSPYAPPGKSLRRSIKETYDKKVSEVAANFRARWGDIWRGRIFE